MGAQARGKSPRVHAWVGAKGSAPAGVSCADVLEAQVGVRFQSLVPGWGSLSLVVRGLGLACSVASFSGAPSSRRLRAEGHTPRKPATSLYKTVVGQTEGGRTRESRVFRWVAGKL